LVSFLGTATVALCTGSRADNMWARHPDNASVDAWRDMRDSVIAAVEVAERNSVVLGVECEYSNVVSSARLGRRLLDEIGSPALAIVLDAANLIPPGRLSDQEPLLKEAFELLGQDIVLAHAKDVRDNGSFCAAGTGGLDYELFLRLLVDAGFDGPLLLHGLSEREVASSLEHVRNAFPRGDGVNQPGKSSHLGNVLPEPLNLRSSEETRREP